MDGDCPKIGILMISLVRRVQGAAASTLMPAVFNWARCLDRTGRCQHSFVVSAAAAASVHLNGNRGAVVFPG